MSLLSLPLKDLRKKRLITISPDATIYEASKMMANNKPISTLVVKDKTSVVGVITERDILARVIATKKNPQKTKVGSVMSKNLLTVSSNATIVIAAYLMHKKKKKKILIKDRGKIVGIITQTDIIQLLSKDALLPWKKKK